MIKNIQFELNKGELPMLQYVKCQESTISSWVSIETIAYSWIDKKNSDFLLEIFDSFIPLIVPIHMPCSLDSVHNFW